jgi:hypothetical protein
MRYESYGWHVQTVSDVNDLEAVYQAVMNAKAETSRPSIIKVLLPSSQTDCVNYLCAAVNINFIIPFLFLPCILLHATP